MPAEQRNILLFFWTSVKYLPVEGFRGLASRLYIYRSMETEDRLPSSHTCFYRLCFPPYSSKAVMQDRLRIITQEHIGCSFGTWWEYICNLGATSGFRFDCTEKYHCSALHSYSIIVPSILELDNVRRFCSSVSRINSGLECHCCSVKCLYRGLVSKIKTGLKKKISLYWWWCGHCSGK